MAHVEKYTAGAVNGLCIHYDRKTENHTNEDIDPSRSHLNYNLRDDSDGLDTRSRLEQRLQEVHCMKRADVKPFATWVVTLPQELQGTTQEEQREFFQATYSFLVDRYGGEKNVLSANVHNDETTPHMHFAFTPVVWDAKKEREKISAKEVLNRKDLQTFHNDLDAYLKQEIPHIYEKGILNDKTIGVDDVKSLKKHSEEIQGKREILEREKEKVIQHAELVNKKAKEVAQKEKQLNEIESDVANCFDVGLKMSELKASFKRHLGITVVDKKSLEKLEKYVNGVAKDAITTKIELRNANSELENLKEKVTQKERALERKDKRIEELTKENEELRSDRDGFRELTYVLRSVLKDRGVEKISRDDYDAHLVLAKLENGQQPKTADMATDWINKLNNGTEMAEHRFKAAFDKLKTWVSNLLEKDKRKQLQRSNEWER